MRYRSTRSDDADVSFETACLRGLAPDGGLYVPAAYPRIDPAGRGEPFADVLCRILRAFAGDDVSDGEAETIAQSAAAAFSHAAVTPLSQWSEARWILELHHGPTLAFKDVAMQVLAPLMDLFLGRSGRRATIVCATSGDTGGAAAHAFARSRNASLVILTPKGRVSPTQRLFMTSTGAANVHVLEVEGDFDACQAMVKQMFADADFAAEVALSGVNSINWARIMAQTVYYAVAQAALGPDTPLRFTVPSGNMGDAFAGYVAARCGLLPGGFELVCAVNENDTLADVIEHGGLPRKQAVQTHSPAMDISVPSNLERLLFEVSGRRSELIADLYATAAEGREVDLPREVSGPLKCCGISAVRVSDVKTLTEMTRIGEETGTAQCPHTAVGTAAMRTLPPFDGHDVVLATAHAAKFPETVTEATGRAPSRPHRMDAISQDERFDSVPADPDLVKDRVRRAAKSALAHAPAQ